MDSRKWLIVAMVACGLATACQDYNTNLSIQTASSTLTYVSPSDWTSGVPGLTITANGTGFASNAIIEWNATDLVTTYVNSTQLTAQVPAADLATPGTVQIAVKIPGSATSPTNNNNNYYNSTTTELSNVVPFTVDPVPGTPPAITSLSASTTSQASTPYCSTQGFILTIKGTNFTSDSVVNWNGSARATTYLSATQLTASISAVDAAFPGTAAVTVTNSVGTSKASSFTLSTPLAALAPPTLSLTDVTPTSSPAGSAGFALLPLNSNTGLPANALVISASQNTTFLPCTVVKWTDSGGVTTTLPTEYIPAAPAMGSIPAHSLQLNAALPAANLAGAAATQTAHIFLMNPPPVGTGGNQSATVPFTIVPPSIASLSSNSTPSCSSSDVALTVTGTNFVNGSVVVWVANPPPALPSQLATTFVNSTQLTATVPAAYIASPGAVSIEVSNSGVLSNQMPFSISPSSPPAPAITSVSPTAATAGSAGATLIVTGTNLLPCSGVQWTNAGVTTQFVTKYVGPTQQNPAQLIATVPAANIASVETTAQVSVATPASSTNTSNSVSFPTVLPTLTSLSASTTSASNTPFCSTTGLTLNVTGTGFADGLVVDWNGSPRPTTLMSATQLTAEISATDTAFLGTGGAAVAITVSGSGPGTNSNSLKFSVMAPPTGTTLPAPIVSSISPTNAAVESLTGPPVALTVNGSGLSPCSAVQWNGASLPTLPTTIFIGSSGIASVIPAANITTAGTDQVTVTTPAPGGGTSGNEPFTVHSSGSTGSPPIAGGSLSLPLMSASQRYGIYVLASTDGSTETPGTTQNVFVSDTCLGVTSGCTPSTTFISVGTDGKTPGNADSVAPSISADSRPNSSADGRYVAFLSSATNLVAGVTNGVMNAYVRDTCAGVSSGCTPSTQIVSVATGGTQANGATTSATISPDGRYVTFASTATNLGASTSSGGIFLRDTCAGAAGCTPSTQPLD